MKSVPLAPRVWWLGLLGSICTTQAQTAAGGSEAMLAISFNPESGRPRIASHSEEPPVEDPHAARLSGDFRSWHSRLSEAGFDVEVGYTAEAMANVAGGWNHGAVAAGLGEVSVQMDPEKWGLWHGLKSEISAIAPHGDGLGGRFTDQQFAPSNIDAVDSAKLYEFWLEQSFADDVLSIRAGRMSTESEWVAELMHQIEIRPGWVLQPDVQFLERSGDSTGGSWAVVVGLRTNLVF